MIISHAAHALSLSEDTGFSCFIGSFSSSEPLSFEASDPGAARRQFHLGDICFVSDDYRAGVAVASHLRSVSDDLLSQSGRSGPDHSCISFNLDCLRKVLYLCAGR